MKRSISLLVLLLALVSALAIALGLSVGAASSVTDGDWISKPEKTLVMCSGEGCMHNNCYAYSFAVVGDTQNLNLADVKSDGADYMSTLYNWILSNKESKNIQYVMGLGDITQSYYKTQSGGVWVQEWENAALALSLLDGRIDYSLVRGNHDISDATDGFNGVFGIGDKTVNGTDNTYYEDLLALSLKRDAGGRAMAGFRDPKRIEDTYRKIEIGGNKYIIFTLDWHPSKEGDACLSKDEVDALTWLEGVLSEHPDHKAIITLHSFLYYDGSLTDITEDRFPIENLGGDRTEWEEVSEVGGNATPDEIWNVLKGYANVEMILSGHMDCDDIVTTQLRGDNGNTVTCMLIDGQTVDKEIEPAGLVAILYVKHDGSVMNVEYVSTIRDSEGKDAYLRNKNQFEVDLDVEDWVEYAGGSIPRSKYDAYTFQVMLDDDSDESTQSTYFGGFNTWDDTLESIHAFNSFAPLEAGIYKTWSILMTRDYTFTKTGLTHNKAGLNPSKTVLDLGGNDFTLAGGTVFLPFYQQTASFHPSFTVMNGNIEINGSARLIRAQHGHSNATGGYSVLDLIDLNIKYASGATNPLISSYDGSSGGPSNLKFNITGCNIDASATGAVTVFDLKDVKNNSNVALTLKGGSIKGSTTDKTTVFDQNFPGDTISFVPDKSGKYTAFIYSNNTQLEGVFYSENEGEYLTFGTPNEASGVYESALIKTDGELTKYGFVPEKYMSANDYPFLVFKNDQLIHAFSDWKKFIDTDVAGKVAYRSGCTVLLRKNYCMDDASGKVTGLYRISDLTLDLGGNTVTTGEKYLFQAIGRNDLGYEKTFVKVTNGTLKGITKYAPIVFNDSTSSTGVESFDFLLEDLTLDVSAGIGIARCYGDGSVGADNSITIKNCTIYRDSMNKSVNLFMMSDTKNMLDIDVNISDTKLVASSLASITLANYNAERESGKGSPDTLTFGEGFTVTLPSDFDVSSYKYALTGGTFCLAKTTENGDGTVNYALYDVNNLVTSYGKIDVKYASAVDHPFVVFKDGKVIYTFSDWYKFLHTDISKSANSALWSGCTVFVRADYSTATASGKASRMHHISDMTFDLNGHTLTSADKHLFQALGMSANEDSTYVKIMNGTLAGVSGGYAPIVFNDSDSSTTVEKFDFVLENVTVDVSSGVGLIKCYNNGTIGAKNTVTLNNCTVYRSSDNASVTLFGLTDNNDILDVSVTVNGGKLEASSMSGITFAKRNANDTLTFGKNESGAYFRVTLPANATAPTGTYETAEDVDCVFVKASENGGYVNYSLYPEVMAGYKIKTSVTLWSNFVYNIYVPKANFNSASVNGNTANYTEVEIDGAWYYLIKVDLPAGETLRDIALTVTLNSGNTTVDANWTLSVYNYTKSVLAGEYDETAKTLMKDMLVYASAAHTYFENTEAVAAKLAEIKTLLGDYAAEMPTGEAKAPADKTYFTDVAVYLGEVPSFRFTLAEGYTSSDFTFKVGNRTVEAIAGEGYVEIVMYAYMMLDDVTFTVKGTDVAETYNLYSYYEYAKTENNAELVTIVEALMKYSVSAYNYRASVIK